MKFFDKAAVFLFNFCLLMLSIILPAVAIAGTPAFYHRQFEKNGVYAQELENGEMQPTVIRYIGGVKGVNATFSDEQINEIVEHIISYLFTDQESFALEMDNVNIEGKGEQDNVSIFGETSVGHMVDVKELFGFFINMAKILGVVGGVLLVWILCRRRHMRGTLLGGTLAFYGVFLGLIALFCAWVAIEVVSTGAALNIDTFLTKLWANFHHLLFPFQADKFQNSFFNDPLTEFLTLDFFMSAVYTVLAVVGVTLAAWFVCIGFLRKNKRLPIKTDEEFFE